MFIERQRHSQNGAVNPAVFEEVRALQSRAHDEFITFVHESGQLVGETYVARMALASALDQDLQPYVGDSSNECFVKDIATDYSSRTVVFDMATGRGVQREKLFTGGDPDYYELEERHWRNEGSLLLAELFEPGRHPELSALAAAKREELVNPDALPARIMTAEEYKRSAATARLSRFTLAHLTEIMHIYSRIAYPDGVRPYLREDEQQYTHDRLQRGEHVGLRRGTVYLDCAKQELHPAAHDDKLNTSLYLNYDIPIGPVKLHFKEDIDMALAYGAEAREFFKTEGISVE